MYVDFGAGESDSPVTKPSQSTEVVAAPSNDRRQRRKFSVQDKLRILSEADACEHGELGTLLRREGLYSSQLATWRRQLKERGEQGLVPAKRGRKPVKDAKDKRIEQLEKQAKKLEKELRISKALIEMQKKAHEILGIALPGVEESESGSLSSSEGAAKEST